jgi:hypothetical protein
VCVYVCVIARETPGLSVGIEAVNAKLDLGKDSTGDMQLATVESRRYHLRIFERRPRPVGQTLELLPMCQAARSICSRFVCRLRYKTEGEYRIDVGLKEDSEVVPCPAHTEAPRFR